MAVKSKKIPKAPSTRSKKRLPSEAKKMPEVPEALLPSPAVPPKAVALSASAASASQARDYVRCFSGPEGLRVLAHLRQMTVERPLGPEISSELLRYIEGQRGLVRFIEKMVSQGKSGG